MSFPKILKQNEYKKHLQKFELSLLIPFSLLLTITQHLISILVKYSKDLHLIRVCSSNAMNNLTSKKQKVCSLSATSTQKPEEKGARGVTCFMEENEISLREVARFDEHKRD